jgi:integrase
MPRRRIPSYRRYKPKNLGLVVIDGKQHYLGTYGTPESLAEYNRLVQEWLTRGSVQVHPEQTDPAPTATLVNEVIVSFLEHAEGHYVRPDGTSTGEVYNLTVSLKPLRSLYGYTPADQFGPLALRAVRDRMIADGLSRSTINARINRIRRMFRWAASVELIPGSVSQAIQTVNGLQKGRSRVKEARPIVPVAVEIVEATLLHLTGPVAAMVRVQLLTGCRTGEVVVMRTQDLTVGEPNWLYRPHQHKNSWRGQERVIILGPKAQAILKEFMKTDPLEWLFKPGDAVAEHHARRSVKRMSKPTPSELSRRCSSPGQSHAPRYDRKTYRHAIVRACDKAGVPRWSPLQLRHTAATLIRTKFGLEAAQIVLGHAKADVTQIYAERDMTKAHAVMAEVG